MTHYFQDHNYHLPTIGDWQELISKCRWVKRRDKHGSVYKIIGPNGNYILLPFDEVVLGSGKVCNDYLSAELPKGSEREDRVLVLRLTEKSHELVSAGGRWLGRLVRPVCDL